MKLLFEYDMSDSRIDEILDRSEMFKTTNDSARQYAGTIITGVVDEMDKIDSMIVEQNPSWQIARMHGVDRNIIRVAVFEMMNQPDVPAAVILDEAVEIAKLYGSDDSPRFVNGVLDGIRKLHFKQRVVHA